MVTLALALLLADPGAHLKQVAAPSVWPVVSDGGRDFVGVLMAGAVVEVEGCEGDGGLGWVAGGRAVVRCSVLRDTDAGEPGANEPALRWGSVRDGGARILRAARADAGVLEEIVPPHTLALVDDAQLRARGWGRRPGGGFVRLSEVWLDRPSPFTGEPWPQLPLAFVVRPLALGADAGVAKYERFHVELDGGQLLIADGGVLPRAAVRVAWARPRPAAVPEGARWVHVDLAQQVLVAYEGDAAVYATLISAGLGDTEEHRTHPGLFRVWLKARHDRMHGEGYFVEEVPLILFFSGGQGLHGAFWHDWFGAPASHGCVNLSMADAQWVFDWATPTLPPGWHTVRPAALGVESLWVHVERAKTPPLAPGPR